MKNIHCTLGNTIDNLDITKNKLAVESKVRPNTISDLVNGKAKSINFQTLENILLALEKLAKEKNIDKTFTVTDVITYSASQSK